MDSSMLKNELNNIVLGDAMSNGQARDRIYLPRIGLALDWQCTCGVRPAEASSVHQEGARSTSATRGSRMDASKVHTRCRGTH